MSAVRFAERGVLGLDSRSGRPRVRARLVRRHNDVTDVFAAASTSCGAFEGVCCCVGPLLRGLSRGSLIAIARAAASNAGTYVVPVGVYPSARDGKF